MSHFQFFYSFHDQEPVTFPLQPLIEIVQRNGCEISPCVDGSFHVSTGDQIGSEVGIHLQEGEAHSFGIERPYYDEKFFALAAELITELGLVMFSDAGLGTYIRDPSQQNHIHTDVSTNAAVICNADELKRAFYNEDVYRELSTQKRAQTES